MATQSEITTKITALGTLINDNIKLSGNQANKPAEWKAIFEKIEEIAGDINDNVAPQSRLEQIITVTTNYNVVITDYQILVDASAANVDIILPTVSESEGLPFWIKKIDDGPFIVSVYTYEFDEVEFIPTGQELHYQGESIEVVSDGSNYYEK